MKTAVVQRRTLRLLFATQIVSGMGVAIGSSVGALLAADLAGVGLSGLAQSATVIGGALAAIPATAIVHRHGRRPSLAAANGVAAVGALLAGTAGADGGAHRSLRAGLSAIIARAPAVLGVTAMAVGHMVMVGIMAMTPVHIRGAGHDAAHTLRIVGVVISVHIAGMYAFAPLIGWLTDRFGRRPLIFAGIALLVTACVLAGGAGYDSVRLGAGLFTVGLGWSCTMVAGSTLLTESVPLERRASAQGLSDLIMGLAGASAGALSGVVVSVWSYPVLALVAAIATVPLIVLGVAIRVERPKESAI